MDEFARQLFDLGSWHENSSPQRDNLAIKKVFESQPNLNAVLDGARRCARYYKKEETPANKRTSLASFLNEARWKQQWTPTPSVAEQREARNLKAVQEALTSECEIPF